MGPQGHVLIARPFGAFFNSLLVESESQRVNHGIVCHHCSIGGGMAYLYRLIFPFIFVFFSQFAHSADYFLSSGYFVHVHFGDGNAKTHYTPASMCSAYAARQNSVQPGWTTTITSSGISSGNFWCQYKLQRNSDGYTETGVYPTVAYQIASSCPSGAYVSYSTNTCTVSPPSCPNGQVFNSSSLICEAATPVCPASGTAYGETSVIVAPGTFPDSALGVDSNGCAISVQCTTIVDFDGRRDCIGNSTFTGEPGTGSPSGVFTQEQIDKAKDGYCQGEVNGTTVYVPCSGVSQNTDTATTTNSDGSTSTTKTSTSCQDGKCTTTETTTTTDAQGNTTASGSTKTESQSDFCQTNPGHAFCKAGSFSGSCEAGFKCDGDAIQCAMAKVQYQNKCAFTPAPNAGAAYFDALTEGMPNNPNSGTVTVGSSMFNTSNLLGASSCTLDKSVTVWGSTINLPFSQVCTALAYMGTLLQAVGFLLGARIITRG